jgi:hypothetical protein
LFRIPVGPRLIRRSGHQAEREGRDTDNKRPESADIVGYVIKLGFETFAKPNRCLVEIM